MYSLWCMPLAYCTVGQRAYAMHHILFYTIFKALYNTRTGTLLYKFNKMTCTAVHFSRKDAGINLKKLLPVLPAGGGSYFSLAFRWSARNFSRPISVRGCLSSPRMVGSGHVATSAPASAQSVICCELLMEAARIWVSKP